MGPINSFATGPRDRHPEPKDSFRRGQKTHSKPPVAFTVEHLAKRDGLRVAHGVLAAVLAHGVSLATDLWVAASAPSAIRDALTRTAPSGSVPAATAASAWPSPLGRPE